MIRDRIKSSEYFTDFFAKELGSIKKFQNALLLNEVREGRIPAVKSAIFSANLKMTVAMFSSGASLREIVASLSKDISNAEESWESVSGYVEMLWMLSMGILLEIEAAEFNRLVALVDRDQLADYVIDFLIAHKIKDRKISETFKFNEPYKSIRKITTSPKTIAQTLLKLYLETEWYKGHSDSYWHDNHKSKENTYFGYWSFEAGAISKIMGLDDSSFAASQYYPIDMVQYKNE